MLQRKKSCRRRGRHTVASADWSPTAVTNKGDAANYYTRLISATRQSR